MKMKSYKDNIFSILDAVPPSLIFEFLQTAIESDIELEKQYGKSKSQEHKAVLTLRSEMIKNIKELKKKYNQLTPNRFNGKFIDDMEK